MKKRKTCPDCGTKLKRSREWVFAGGASRKVTVHYCPFKQTCGYKKVGK